MGQEGGAGPHPVSSTPLLHEAQTEKFLLPGEPGDGEGARRRHGQGSPLWVAPAGVKHGSNLPQRKAAQLTWLKSHQDQSDLLN